MIRNLFHLLRLIALVVAGFVSLKIVSMVRRAMATPAETQVVIAAKDLNVGQLITEADVRVTPMAVAALPQGAFHTLSQVIGRGVVLPMQANEVRLGTQIARPHASPRLPP